MKTTNQNLQCEDDMNKEDMKVEQELLKYRLQTLLKGNIVEIVFTKVNGEQRNMRCTLDPDKLPVGRSPMEATNRKVNEDVLPVWDVEKNDWRSFRIDSVLDYLVVRGD